jgi:FkbM family methyltransferase
MSRTGTPTGQPNQQQQIDPRTPVPAGEYLPFKQWTQESVTRLQNQLIETRKSLYALQAERKLAFENKKARQMVTLRSQFGEDLVIWELLEAQTSGFYIEVGAFDGRSFSVSSFLDDMGWEGLLVEAIPEMAEQCKINRPHARVEHAALTKPNGPAELDLTVTADQFGGMLSYTGESTDHAQKMRASGVPAKSVRVQAKTLASLLDSYQTPVSKIDVAIIDVEGSELDVLAGLDLARYAPRLLIVEDNSGGRDEAMTAFFRSQPYTLMGMVGVSRIYLHNVEVQAKRLGGRK